METDFRIRPKSDYLHTASWEELYILTKHWLSDMNFFKDEMQFLNNLIGRYFIWMAEKDNFHEAQVITAKIIELDKTEEALSAAIKKHKADLALLMEKAFTNENESFRREHVKLEDDLAKFTDTFRKVKKEVFDFSEKAIENDKLHHLLRP